MDAEMDAHNVRRAGILVPFSMLLGQTLTRVERTTDDQAGDLVLFTTAEGRRFELYHKQDCCELVRIEDVAGHLDDLVGAPIVLADESSNRDAAPARDESATWTFYRVGTVKGTVVLRWYGQSNGYYSEGVDFVEVPA
jgi:hypothetical protein